MPSSSQRPTILRYHRAYASRMATTPNPDPMRELFDAGVTEVEATSDTRQAAGLAGLMMLLAGLWAIVGAAVTAILIPVLLFGVVYGLFSSTSPLYR
jgi:hypothetical protein